MHPKSLHRFFYFILFCVLSHPVSIFGIDNNGNGISDVFEKLHGTYLQDEKDNDFDGFSNLAEYYFGGNPLMGNDLNQLMSSSLDPKGGVTLQWDTAFGMRYQIWVTNDLKRWEADSGVFTGNGNPLEYRLKESPLEKRFLAWRLQGLGALDEDDDLLDAWEEFTLMTDPQKADTDHDQLNDGEEFSLGTDPNEIDTDGDRISDDAEILMGSDPVDEFSTPQLFYVARSAPIVLTSYSVNHQTVHAITSFQVSSQPVHAATQFQVSHNKIYASAPGRAGVVSRQLVRVEFENSKP